MGLASPGMMERGLVASLFHSTRIQDEIQLQRSRPATLDQDALAAGNGREAGPSTPAGKGAIAVEEGLSPSGKSGNCACRE